MVTPGKNFEGQRGFPTPNVTPETSACRTFRVPASDDWLGLLMASVLVLTKEYNYYDWGVVTPEEAAQAWNDIIMQSYEDSLTSSCDLPSYPTPFWDEDSDVDDAAAADVQAWYGRVTDLDNPTTTFIEDAAIYSFAGFLAIAATPAAAILFTTIAPSFVVAIRRGDLGEIIRLYLDGEQATEVDTSGYAEGDVIPVTLAGDPDLSTHDLMLVKMS